MTRRSVPFISIAVTATFLALAGCSDSPSTAPSPSATVTVNQAAAQASAAWLLTTAAGTPLLQAEYDGTIYDDHGLTADLVLALLAVGDTDSAQPFAQALADPAAVAMYIGDGTNFQYAGSTAKLLATLEAAGIDTSDLGGRDLGAELSALQAPSGRFSDLGGDDYSTTISQAWAILALGASDEAPATAVEYLTAQHCPGLGFPVQLSDTTPAECVPDVDVTAFAVSALIGAGVPADAPAVAESLVWLETVAVIGGPGQYWVTAGTEEANINSTAVVATALADAGEDPAPALSWLKAQSLTSGAFPLAGAADMRATTQATIALAGTGLAGLIG